ncbi:hypothetical protein FRB91_009002 [Serendipita sp. 411]|nr:hypothetical protein FRB91_009002 [Serendipita sp. 411]
MAWHGMACSAIPSHHYHYHMKMMVVTVTRCRFISVSAHCTLTTGNDFITKTDVILLGAPSPRLNTHPPAFVHLTTLALLVKSTESEESCCGTANDDNHCHLLREGARAGGNSNSILDRGDLSFPPPQVNHK